VIQVKVLTDLRERLVRLLPWRRRALVLAGGGVTGGMYEVGALAALDDGLADFQANAFDLYVGSSAGAVVASLMANGVRPSELYRILDEERDDPLNFHRGSVYHKGAFGTGVRNFAQFLWAVGKKAVTDFHLEWPDILARSGGDMPAGFFSVAPLEAYLRESFTARRLPNRFAECRRPLLIAAIDLDRAERVVFGSPGWMDVPISEAIAASSAIPGFFEPVTIKGRDFMDGDVGHTGHADLAVEAGARTVVVVNPAVPLRVGSEARPPVKRGGLYAIMEQAGHITSVRLLELALGELRLRYPRVDFHVIQPDPVGSALSGPSMGFEASHSALRFGYESVRDWLRRDGAAPLRERFSRGAVGLAGELAESRAG
jgi:predicted acylesterase/phospholipase RssA